jgi:hypothetical protein
MASATFSHRAFKIGDGKDIDLNGQNIVNPGIPALAHGTYTGNGTVDRAIAHGLGKIPHIVFVFNLSISQMMILDCVNSKYQALASGGFGQMYSVSAADATNFFVGYTTGYWGNEDTVNFSFIAM